jgi:hypothetical protein
VKRSNSGGTGPGLGGVRTRPPRRRVRSSIAAASTGGRVTG